MGKIITLDQNRRIVRPGFRPGHVPTEVLPPEVRAAMAAQRSTQAAIPGVLIAAIMQAGRRDTLERVAEDMDTCLALPESEREGKVRELAAACRAVAANLPTLADVKRAAESGALLAAGSGTQAGAQASQEAQGTAIVSEVAQGTVAAAIGDPGATETDVTPEEKGGGAG